MKQQELKLTLQKLDVEEAPEISTNEDFMFAWYTYQAENFDKELANKIEPSEIIAIKKTEIKLLYQMIGAITPAFYDRRNAHLFAMWPETQQKAYLGYIKHIVTKIQARINELKIPVAQTFHFVCLGKLEAHQLEHIGLWSKLNPNYRINIVTDSEAYLIKEQEIRTAKAAARGTMRHMIHNSLKQWFPINTDKLHKKNLYAIKGDLYKHVNKPSETIDTGIIKFLKEQEFSKEDIRINELIPKNEDTFRQAPIALRKEGVTDVQLTTLSEFWTEKNEFIKPMQHVFIKEAVLRGNMETATDIAKLVVLHEQGGIAIPEYDLPVINRERFKEVFEENNLKQTDESFIYSLIYDRIFQSTKYKEKFPTISRMLAENMLVDQNVTYDTASIIPMIDQIVNTYQTEDAYLKLLGPLKPIEVDPFFGFDANYLQNGMMAAMQDSETIERIASLYETIDHYITAYNFDGLQKQQPEPKTPSYIPALSKEMLQKGLSDQRVYDYKNYSFGYPIYKYKRNWLKYTKEQELKDLNKPLYNSYHWLTPLVLDQDQILLTHQMLYDRPQTSIQAFQKYTRNLIPHTISTYTSRCHAYDRLSNALFIKTMQNLDVVNQTNYSNNIVIMLSTQDRDLTSLHTLFDKNKTTSILYQYSQEKQRIILIKKGNKFSFDNEQNRTRVIVAGHDEEILGLGAEKIFELLKQLPVPKLHIQKLVLMGCGITNWLESNNWMNEVTAGLPVDLFELSLEPHSTIEIETIKAYNESVAIDDDGSRRIEKTTITNKGTKKVITKFAEEGQYSAVFSVCKTADGKPERRADGSLVVVFDGRTYGSDYHRNTIAKIMPEPFGMHDLFPFFRNESTKLTQNVFVEESTLYMPANDDIIRKLFTYSEEGDVLLGRADATALILAMGEAKNDIVVVDANLANLQELGYALRVARTKENFQDFVDFLTSTKEVKERIKITVQVLFGYDGKQQEAYNRLRNRVLNKEIGFYDIDLSEAQPTGKPILPLRLNQNRFKAIYLGDVQAYLKGKIPKLEAKQKKQQVTKQIFNQLKKNLTLIAAGQKADGLAKIDRKNTPVYYQLGETSIFEKTSVNELTSKDILEDFQRLYRSQKIYNRFDLNDEIITYQNHAAHLRDANTALQSSKEGIEAGLNDRSVPILSKIGYDAKSKQYAITYLNSSNPAEQEKIVKTTDARFAQVNGYLDKLNLELNTKLANGSNGKLYRRFAGRIDKVDDAKDLLEILIAMHNYFENGLKKPQATGNETLDTALALHTDLGLASLALGATFTGKMAVSLARIGLKQINHTGLQQYLIRTKFGGFSKAFNNVLMGVSLLLNITDNILTGIELSEVEAGEQQDILITNLTFGLLGSVLLIGIILFPPLAPIFLALGLLIEFIGYITINLLTRIKHRPERVRKLAELFQSAKDSWNNGGYYLDQTVWRPNVGAVIDRIDLSRADAQVEFATEGVQIKNMDRAPRGITPMTGYFNLMAALNELPNSMPYPQKINGFYYENNAVTCMLPSAYPVYLEPGYSEGMKIFDADYHEDKEFEILRKLARFRTFQNYQSFPFIYQAKSRDGAPIASKSIGESFSFVFDHYKAITYPTKLLDVQILLGNKTYTLIAPGVHKDTQIGDRLYVNHLKYTIAAPAVGKADITIMMNSGQGNIEVTQTNPEVAWHIRADHVEQLHGLQIKKIDTNSFVITLIYYLWKWETKNITKPRKVSGPFGLISTVFIKTTITVKTPIYLNTTFVFPKKALEGRLTVQTPKNIYQVKSEGNRIKLEIMAVDVVDKENKAAAVAKIQTAIANIQTQGLLTVTNFKLNENSVRDNAFYKTATSTLFFTAYTGKFAGAIKRQNTQLIHDNYKQNGLVYALYQGDMIFKIGTKYCEYKGMVWSAEISTGLLKNVYIPLGHLPNVYSDEQLRQKAYTTTSVVEQINPKNDITTDGILLKQTYTTRSSNEAKTLIYLIDNESNIQLIDTQIGADDIENKDLLTKINAYMVASAEESGKNIGAQFDASTASSGVVQVSSKELGFYARIGNERMVIPPSNTYPSSLNTHVSAHIPTITTLVEETEMIVDVNVLHDPNYEVNLAGAFEYNDTAHSYVYFWKVTQRSTSNLFYALYKQINHDIATEIDLESFGIKTASVSNIGFMQNGLRIDTDQDNEKYSYQLTLDENLILVSVTNPWIGQSKGYWAQSVKEKIREFKDWQQSRAEQGEKTIHLQAIISINGLQHPDSEKRIKAWYDTLNELFFITIEPTTTQLICLGIANNGEGIWMADMVNKVNQKIYYLPAVNVIRTNYVFPAGGILIPSRADRLPKPQRFFSKLSHPIIKDQYNGTSVNTHTSTLNIRTKAGLLLEVSRNPNSSQEGVEYGFRIDTLLGLTKVFVKREFVKFNSLERAKVKTFFDSLKSMDLKYPELIELFTAEIKAWYHAESTEIYIAEAAVYEAILGEYLGIDANTKTAYFRDKENEKMAIQIQKNGTLSKDNIKCSRHSRVGNLLIYNADGQELILSSFLHFANVNELLIKTTQNQSESTAFFLIIPGNVPYPILHIDHQGKGSFTFAIRNEHFELPPISQKNNQLWIHTQDHSIVIHNAFEKYANNFHQRLKVNILNRGRVNTYPIAPLVRFYRNAVGKKAKKDGSVSILMPTIPPSSEKLNQGWSLYGNNLVE